MAPGAWGSGLNLAQRMRAAAPEPTSTFPVAAPVKTPFVPIQPPTLSPHDWYHHNPSDGSIHPPPITSLDTHTLAISILILHNQQLLMLRDWDEEEDEKDEKQGGQPKWKIPSGTLQCNEDITQAVRRVLSSHLPSSMLSSFTATHYVTLEHYPSLKQQWMRVAVTGTINQPKLVSEQDAFHWHPVDDLSAHLTYNDHQLLDAHASGRTIPITYTTTSSTSTSASPSPYFPYHLLELAILHDHKVLLVKYKHDTHEWWSLPQTHVDRGEHLGFTSIRLARALFGMCLESVDGIISINTQARTDLSCEGGRFTTVVDMAKQPDKAKDGNTTATNTKQQAIDEAVKKAAAAAAAATTSNNETDAATSLSSAAAQLSLTSSTPISSTPASVSASASDPSSSASTSISTRRDLPMDPDFNAATAPPHEWFTLDQLRDLDAQHLLRADLLAMLTPVLQDNATGVPLIHV